MRSVLFPSVSLMPGVYIHLCSTWTEKVFFPMPCCLILLSFLSFTLTLLCSSDLFLPLLHPDHVLLPFLLPMFQFPLFIIFFFFIFALFPFIWLLGHCLLPPVLLVSPDAPTSAAIPQCTAALQNRALVNSTERLLTKLCRLQDGWMNEWMFGCFTKISRVKFCATTCRN